AGLVLMATLRIVVVVYVLALMGAVAWHAAARLLPERPWRTIAAGAFSSLAVMAAGAFAAFAAPTLVGEIDARVIRTRLSGGDEQVIMSLLRNAWRIISETMPEGLFAADLGPIFGTPVAVCVLTGTVLAVVLARRVLWGWLVALLILQWVVFGVTDRYLLPLVPLALLGWWRLMGLMEWCVGRYTHGLLGVAMLLFWLITNFVFVIKFVVDQQQPLLDGRRVFDQQVFMRTHEGGRYVALQEMGDWLREQTPDDTLVISRTRRPEELIYYSERAVIRPGKLLEADRERSALYVLNAHDSRPLQRKMRAMGFAIAEEQERFESHGGKFEWRLQQLTPIPTADEER
ncbi:MAG: hypothetical protein MI741_11130, partial [Rhodospirillales bacterium]|nr:hypothetical protein [Rhodospirillales bacterium]